MIKTCIKQCKTCQVHQSMSVSAPIHHWERTTKPWVQIHIDFTGPYLGKMFLVLTDTYINKAQQIMCRVTGIELFLCLKANNIQHNKI